MTRPGLLLLVTALTALATAGCMAGGGPPEVAARPSDAPVRLDVIWVATDLDLVIEMLKLAGVTRDDVVYDLGAGDGRIVIAAAREFGARGVGVELDPGLVGEARANAARAGVADRVSFRLHDLFETDLGEATVVTLFLSPEVNARLRPKLLRELRPGSRIVSHRYGIGDWPAEQTVVLTVDGRPAWLFLWRVPDRAPPR
jgi:SAM-dependent methyltransferase